MSAITATDVIRTMYAAHLPQSGDTTFDLVGEVWRTTATLLGLEYDHSAEAADRIGPVSEQVIALLYATAGVVDTRSDDTPDCMATTEQARQIMARAVDVSDIHLVQPVDDERRAAHLVDTTPDVD